MSQGRALDRTGLVESKHGSSGLLRRAFAARRGAIASYEIFRIEPLQEHFDVARLPYTLRILLENVLRHEDGVNVTGQDVEAVAGWVASAEPSQEISFTPGRVLLQDFTGVPAVVDLAAMRNAMRDLGGDPERINPLLPRRARDRPLGAGGRVRDAACDHAERRARVRAQPRALRVPALGPGGVRRLQGRAAEHGHRPPGQPRVSRPRRRRPGRRRPSPTRSSAPTRTRR